MNLYNLNILVNKIVSKPKRTVSDGMYLSELLYNAELEGCRITFDRENKQYIITKKGDDEIDITGRL